MSRLDIIDRFVMIDNADQPRDDLGRWAKGQFSHGEREGGLSKLAAVPDEADQDEHTFKGAGPQVRMKALGFAGMGGIYGGSKKAPHELMELDPAKVKYSQGTVIRAGVEKKLGGHFDNAETSAAGAPTAVKVGDEYHLQQGHHRAAAQVLATGKVTAMVTEAVTDRRTKKTTYKKPSS